MITLAKLALCSFTLCRTLSVTDLHMEHFSDSPNLCFDFDTDGDLAANNGGESLQG